MSINVTTIDKLKEMSQGEIVKFPPFIEGEDFYARLRRPSMLKLVESGKIPNQLLTASNSLFTGQVGQSLEENESFLADVFQVIDILAEAVFVEPTWQQIKDAGIELTDEQYMFIFNYTQEGVKQLESFRKE